MKLLKVIQKFCILPKKRYWSTVWTGASILASNRELDFCLLPGSHANVMTFPQGSTEHLSSSSLGSRTRLSPCRFDHNLWQMVNTAEAIRKSLSSLMEERVSALINIRPCSTFSHCKSSLVDLERVSTLRLRYQHRLKARDRLMCHRSSLGAQNPLRRRRPCIQTALNEIAAHTLKHRTLPPKLSHTVSLQDACKPPSIFSPRMYMHYYNMIDDLCYLQWSGPDLWDMPPKNPHSGWKKAKKSHFLHLRAKRVSIFHQMFLDFGGIRVQLKYYYVDDHEINLSC